MNERELDQVLEAADEQAQRAVAASLDIEQDLAAVRAAAAASGGGELDQNEQSRSSVMPSPSDPIDAALEEEAPPFDVEAGAARDREAARARGLLSEIGGELVAQVGVEVVGIGIIALMGRAAGASCAFAVGRGLTALGSHLENRKAECGAEQALTAEWEHVLRSVALCNARIGVLQGTVESSGWADPVTLPAPLVLGQQTLTELRAWCVGTGIWLEHAEREVADRSAHAIEAIILRHAVELTGLAGFDVPGGQSVAGAGKHMVALGELTRDDVIRMAARLSADVSADEREMVARLAERVLAAHSKTEARNRLGDMRVRVEQANEVAAVRLTHATEAAQLMQPLAHADVSVQPLRADLLKVVAGDIPLTLKLREQACRAAADVQRSADRRYVREIVTESLAELGYAIDEGFQNATVNDGLLQVTRDEWNAHVVRIRLDDEKQALRAVVVRTQIDGGSDAGLADADRESQWGGIQGELRAKLAARNVRYEVRSFTRPGERPIPVLRSALGQTRLAQVQTTQVE